MKTKTKSKSKSKRRPWIAAARAAGAVGPSGKVLTKVQALAAGIAVPGFVKPRNIRLAGFGVRTKPKNKARRAAQVLEVQAGQAARRAWEGARNRNRAAAERMAAGRAAAKATRNAAAAAKAAARRRASDKRRLGGMAKSDAWRESKGHSGRKRGYTRGRSYTKGTRYAQKPEAINFAEAAIRSGAVWPAKFPAGHPAAGRSTKRAGKAMTLREAVAFQVPVVGYLSREMLQGFNKRVPTKADGSPDPKQRQAMKKAYDYLETMRHGGVRLKDGTFVPRSGYKKLAASRLKGAKRVTGISSLRATEGSAWRRAPEYFSRSGKSRGVSYRKGQHKADYKQEWSTKAAKWQSGGGEHLRVKFRKGRGVVYRTPQYLGFSPSKHEADTLLLGGFAGPIGSPGGRVKLNSGRRGKRRASARKPRNSKGRFLKTKTNGKRRRKSRRNKGSKSLVAKVFNNGRRRSRRGKKRSKVLLNRRRRGARRVKTNKRHYRRGKRSSLKLKLNGKRRRRARSNGKRRHARRNPGGMFGLQLSTLKDPAFLMQIAHVGVGMTGTALLSAALMRAPVISKLAYQQGALGTAGRFGICVASAAGLSALAYAGRNVKLVGPQGWKNVLVGGVVYGAANLLSELFSSPLVPTITVGRAGRAGASSASMADWMELSGGVGGMGAVYSAADLVAGESAAQPFQMGGLGSGGVPIPIEDLRGYPGQYGGGVNGLRDWVELQPDAAVDRDSVGAAGESF